MRLAGNNLGRREKQTFCDSNSDLTKVCNIRSLIKQNHAFLQFHSLVALHSQRARQRQNKDPDKKEFSLSFKQ